jgi:hypothetical protein
VQSNFKQSGAANQCLNLAEVKVYATICSNKLLNIDGKLTQTKLQQPEAPGASLAMMETTSEATQQVAPVFTRGTSINVPLWLAAGVTIGVASAAVLALASRNRFLLKSQSQVDHAVLGTPSPNSAAPDDGVLL